jgi:DNA-binding NarL/FixJ family response regulator
MRVLLVEDHAALREPLARLLAQQPGITRVDQAGSLAEARPLLDAADVVVLDLHLPDGDGLDLLRDYRRGKADAIVLVLSGSSDEPTLAEAVEAGASAVLEKTAGIDQFFDALAKLGRGEPVMTTKEVVDRLRVAGTAREQSAEGRAKLARLTPREREVLQALADGLSTEDIATRLDVSTGTARNHVANTLTKLGVESRLQAVVFAIRHGGVVRPLGD